MELNFNSKTSHMVNTTEMFLKGVQQHIDEERKKRFAESNQLSLGQIIEKLEVLAEKSKEQEEERDEPMQVDYDFGTCIPTKLASWRGNYSELALGYMLSGYDNDKDHFAKTTVHELLAEMKSAMGKVFDGWKGGEFMMGENTPVWVDNQGNASNTAIIDIVDDGWRVLIMTQYHEW